MESEGLDKDSLKKLAVEGALDWIENNYDLTREFRIGAGSGSTVSYAFPRLADYSNITAIPTSSSTKKRLKEFGVNIDQLKSSDQLAFDLDGADEVDPELNLIKGGGGCHYWEKKVAKRSELFIIVVDQTKMVNYLGQTFPLPVEVSPENMYKTRKLLEKYGNPSFRRTTDGLFWTDNGNVIVDVDLTKKMGEDELIEREREINRIDGVVENGFFVNRKADIVFVGTEDGLEIFGNENI